jgi:subtilisin family serine protease
MGAGPAAAAVAPKVEVDDLSPRAVAKVITAPEVRLAVRSMPIRLIKPFKASGPAAAGTAWGVAAIGAERSEYTGANATVAVLDTGIERSHPAFAGMDLVEKDFSGAGDGDKAGHGTHCAGTIFGREVAGERIGVAPGVRRALIGKVLGDDGSGNSEMIFQALNWAVENGANIISMSLGFDFPGMVVQLVDEGWPEDLATSIALEAYRGNLRMFDAIMGLMRAGSGIGRDAIVVAATGNESRREQDTDYRIAASLPAAAEDVISVAAVGEAAGRYRVAEFSNSMPTVAAPGVDIQSAWPGGGLHTISGTSMACPHVAGAAALWWEAVHAGGRAPTARNVSARLLSSTRSDLFLDGNDEADIGQGMITAP